MERSTCDSAARCMTWVMPWRAHHVEHRGLVAQIDSFKDVLGVLRDRFEVNEVAGVGQAIEVDQGLDLWAVDEVLDDVRADESRPAGHQQAQAGIGSVLRDLGLDLGAIASRSAVAAAVSTGAATPEAFVGFIVRMGGSNVQNLAQASLPIRQLQTEGPPQLRPVEHRVGRPLRRGRILGGRDRLPRPGICARPPASLRGCARQSRANWSGRTRRGDRRR